MVSRSTWCSEPINPAGAATWSGLAQHNQIPRGKGGGATWSSFAGYVPLASQNTSSNIVYSVAKYKLHLSHFWANVIVISRTEFNASRRLNIKTTAGTIF